VPGGGLSHGLKERHLSMIALGGVIGGGLFVGSGAGIAAAGPSIVAAYAVGGLLIMLVMRMLGEMSAAHPSSGSFSVHADRAIGPWAGFTAGWMFWTLLCVAVAAQSIGAAAIMTGWFPGTESWMWVALFMAACTAANLAAVSSFGEFEYWFAAVKVAAIGLFLLLGAAAVLGLLPGQDSPGTAHFTLDGGLAPGGVSGLIVGVLVAVFAYGGLETVTIAAAESADPRRSVARAVRTTMSRIEVIYIGSMLVIVALVPWNSPAVTEQGPYAAALDAIGVPGGAQLMNVIVLLALLSAMVACVYASSRMAHSLAERYGPRPLAKVSGGVPRRAVLLSSAIGFCAVLLSYWWPETVFSWLLNMTGAAVLVVWAFTAVAQLRSRRRLEREAPERLTVRMWCFPYLTYVALAGVLAVLLMMLHAPDTRAQLTFTAGFTVLLAATGYVRQRRTRRPVTTRRAPAV
jgi:GABA permease